MGHPAGGTVVLGQFLQPVCRWLFRAEAKCGDSSPSAQNDGGLNGVGLSGGLVPLLLLREIIGLLCRMS
jgi:hypothetical protein